MPEPMIKRGRPSLFAQIALRLAMAAVAFALLDAALVVFDYAREKQVLADDFVGQQASRVEAAWREGGLASPLTPPKGATAWAYAVVDASGRPAAQGGDTRLLAGLTVPNPNAIDWTRRDRADRGLRISGIRRCADSRPCWIAVSAEASGWRIYAPVIADELLDHVVEPLVPLLGLLLIVNVAVVRRMLAPLSSAAAQVEAFDPRRMDARMTEPASASREVASLVATLNRALDRLQRAMALLKDFTADAAHELRTPLSVLRLRIEALPPGRAREQLREDVLGMTRLANQMLDLAQADVLSLEQAETVDLAEVAREVVTQTALLAFAKGYEVKLADRGAAPVRGSADALGRVLRNLVENAIAHAERPGPIEVTVGPGAQLSVRDHGVGLETTDPAVIFRRFWRKRRDVGRGAGLGLGIARSIVEAHGGEITAANAPDGGAEFRCTFPALDHTAAVAAWPRDLDHAA